MKAFWGMGLLGSNFVKAMLKRGEEVQVWNRTAVSLTAGLKDTLFLSKTMGVSVEELITLFNSWNPGTLVQARLKRMTGDDHAQPSWELAMARKDTQLFLDTAQQGGAHLTILPAIAALMDEWIAKGFGHHDWTIIGKD